MEKETKIRTLIADDHSMFIDGLKALLKLDKDIEVVAVAHNGVEAYDIIGKMYLSECSSHKFTQDNESK